MSEGRFREAIREGCFFFFTYKGSVSRTIEALECIRGSLIGTLLAIGNLIDYHSDSYRQASPQGGLEAVRKKEWGSLGEGCPFLFLFAPRARISRSFVSAPQK